MGTANSAIVVQQIHRGLDRIHRRDAIRSHAQPSHGSFRTTTNADDRLRHSTVREAHERNGDEPHVG
jgi:hypothetical protein